MKSRRGSWPVKSAFAFTVLVALVLVTPILLAAYAIAQQSDTLMGWLKRAREGGTEVPDWVARLPIAAESMEWWCRAGLSDPKAATQVEDAECRPRVRPPYDFWRSTDTSAVPIVLLAAGLVCLDA
ncbi:hypothetical protein ACE103_06025 [Bradyrhizobium sp. ma5]|uniref:hypothetical protein n=1 Tax=Bradyrhizobium sp. ma5 TaxID=3344828 RepID=UPI0035D4C164